MSTVRASMSTILERDDDAVAMADISVVLIFRFFLHAE
jgi:hypothetical protein